jgi:hypothetical protein
MSSYKIHVWSCISGQTSYNTPTKVVKKLSQVKFNGESNFSTFDHIFQFIKNCKKYDINEGVLCLIFTHFHRPSQEMV